MTTKEIKKTEIVNQLSDLDDQAFSISDAVFQLSFKNGLSKRTKNELKKIADKLSKLSISINHSTFDLESL